MQRGREQHTSNGPPLINTMELHRVEPAFFRDMIGMPWDILYGILTIMTTWLVTDKGILDVREQHLLYVIVMNADFLLAIDSAISAFIRIFHIRRNIRVLTYNALIGIIVDFMTCLTPLILTLWYPKKERNVVYRLICMFRVARVYNRNQYKTLNTCDRVYATLRKENPKMDKECRENEASQKYSAV